MTCKQRDKVFDQASDPQHLGACDDCTEAAQILARSRDLLVQNRVQIPVNVRVELRQQLDMELERGQNRRRFWLPALAGSAAVALLTFTGLNMLDSPKAPTPAFTHHPVIVRTAKPLPLDRAIKLPSAEEIRFGSSSIRILSQSALEFRSAQPGQPGWATLQLNAGSAQLNVRAFAKDERFTLSTPAARIEIADAKFRVDVVATRTRLQVERGTLQVRPKHKKDPIMLRPGQSLTLEHAQTAALNRPKAPARVVSPAPERKRIKRTDPITRRLRNIAARTKRRPRTARAEAPKVKPVLSPKTPQAPRRARVADSIQDETPSIPKSAPPKTIEPAKPVESAAKQPAPAVTPQAQPTTPKPMDAFALMKQADALRRDGKLEDAQTLYGLIGKRHSVLAEEALYQQANLLQKLGRRRSARTILQQAERRYQQGALQKERTALQVRLMLSAGETREAAARLQRSGSSLELHSLRLKTAESLMSQAPQQSLSLIAQVLKANVPQRLLTQARSLQSEAQKLLQKK